MNLFKVFQKIAEIILKIIAFIFRYFLAFLVIAILVCGFYLFKGTKFAEKHFPQIVIQEFHDHESENTNNFAKSCEKMDRHEIQKEVKRISNLFIAFLDKAQNGGNASYEVTELCEFFDCEKDKISKIVEFSGVVKISKNLQNIAFNAKSKHGVLFKKNIFKKHIQIIKKIEHETEVTKNTVPQNLMFASNLVLNLDYQKSLEILQKISNIEGLDQEVLNQISYVKNELEIINGIKNSLKKDAENL